jgi:hypothetical protein
MARIAMELQLKGWDTFQKMMGSPEFMRVLGQKIHATNKRMAQFGATVLSDHIPGHPPPNSPVTIALKESAMPLVDHGTLRTNVSGKTIGSWGFVVGTVRRTASGSNLAHMLETGWTQKVTPKMRKLFQYWAGKTDGKIKPLKASTTHIKVPPRPYMRVAFFDDKTYRNQLLTAWKDATHKTYLHFSMKGRGEKWK